jgi:hypothetical protein
MVDGEPRALTDDDRALVAKRAAESAQEAELDLPLNPESVERAMRYCSLRISRGVRVVTTAEREFRTADRAFDKAFALAFLEYDGPQTEKRYAATEATMTLREARDVAHLAFQYAKRTAEALEDDLRTLQSVNKSIIAMYGATR